MKMRRLLLVAAISCIAVVAATSQPRIPDSQVPTVPAWRELSVAQNMTNESVEEYEIEMDRLPKLSVFRDSQQSLQSIVREFPLARQINILDAKGEAIYKYLPSSIPTNIKVPSWPKGLYFVELFMEHEKVVTDKRIFIL